MTFTSKILHYFYEIKAFFIFLLRQDDFIFFLFIFALIMGRLCLIIFVQNQT